MAGRIKNGKLIRTNLMKEKTVTGENHLKEHFLVSLSTLKGRSPRNPAKVQTDVTKFAASFVSMLFSALDRPSCSVGSTLIISLSRLYHHWHLSGGAQTTEVRPLSCFPFYDLCCFFDKGNIIGVTITNSNADTNISCEHTVC